MSFAEFKMSLKPGAQPLNDEERAEYEELAGRQGMAYTATEFLRMAELAMRAALDDGPDYGPPASPLTDDSTSV